MNRLALILDEIAWPAERIAATAGIDAMDLAVWSTDPHERVPWQQLRWLFESLRARGWVIVTDDAGVPTLVESPTHPNALARLMVTERMAILLVRLEHCGPWGLPAKLPGLHTPVLADLKRIGLVEEGEETGRTAVFEGHVVMEPRSVRRRWRISARGLAWLDWHRGERILEHKS